MRPLLAALSALALLAPSADAGNEPYIVGTTCGLVTVEQLDVTGQGFEGVLFAAVAAADGFGALSNPVPVSLTCRLLVEGVPLKTETSPLTLGAAVVAGPISFQAFPNHNYSLCTDVEAVGTGGTHTVRHCADVAKSDVPPQEVCDIVPICPVVPAARVMSVVPQVIPLIIER